MVFVYVYSTLPSVKMNRYLGRVKQAKINNIEDLQEAEDVILQLNEALDNDPITVETYLRRRFGHAKREGEVEIITEPK